MPEIFKQVADKLNSSGSVLIILPPLPSADAVAASLALMGYLSKQEKDVVVVSSDGSLNQRVEFLPGYEKILRELNLSKGFVIDVSTKRTQIAELSYKKESDKLSIFLKPTTGEFSEEDVSFRSSKFPYDAVVTIGLFNLESLGDFYGKLAELLFETPIINIDNRGSNENFGQYNLVELTSSSYSEIVFDLISQMEKELIDQNIATALLAGIIAETNSFQHTKTTPQAFLKASQLVGMGGNQQDIVVRFFKNKSMGFLKLWGRVLARIKDEPEHFLVYSVINKVDVEKSGASNEDVAAVIKEMVIQLGFAKIHIFLREYDQQSTEVYVSAPPSLNLGSVFAQYQPVVLQPQTIRFVLPEGLNEAEPKVLDSVRKEASKLS